jgi:hypothetical protein
MSVLAELIAKLSIKVDGSADAKKELKGTEDAATDVEEKGGGKLSKFGEIAKTAFGIAGASAAAASVAILAAGKVVFSFANDATAAISEVGHKTKQSGLESAEAYQRLSHAADVTGTSIDTVSKAAKKAELGLRDVASGGGKPFADALKEIGLEAADLENLNASERLGLIGDALNTLATNEDRAAVATRLFGEEAGPSLLGFLEQGTEGLEKLGAAAGDVFGDEEIEKAQKFQDSLTGLKRTVTQAAGSVAVALTPALEAVVGVVQDWLKENDEFISQDLPKILTTIVNSATKIVPVFLSVAKTVAKLVEDAEPLIDRFSIFLGDKLAKGLGSTETLLERLLPLVLALAEAILEVVEGIEKAYNWATTLGSIETNQGPRGSPGFKEGPGRGGFSKEQQEEAWLAQQPAEIARRQAAQEKKNVDEIGKLMRETGGLIIGEARSKNRKLTTSEIASLQKAGYSATEIDSYQASVKRPKGSGRGKSAKAEPVEQEFHLTSFETLLQSTLGEDFDVKNLDLRKAALDPAEIKPEAIVTVNNFNFDIDQEIRGNADPKQIADMSARSIREFFDAELASAGQSLQTNIAR